MPIFDDVIPHSEVWPADAFWPRRRAEALLRRFRANFPSIHYDLFWETRLLNAQAFFGDQGRTVRLYGGLARHRRVHIEAIAFAIAHETGHHLGGLPHDPLFTTLSSEDRSNQWAVEVGLPRVLGPAAGRRFAERGLAQLTAVWGNYRRRHVPPKALGRRLTRDRAEF